MPSSTIVRHGRQMQASQKKDFTYGVLYGTKKQSNKKDWHILRNIFEKLPADEITLSPEGL
jgi:hypothetical protein